MDLHKTPDIFTQKEPLLLSDISHV